MDFTALIPASKCTIYTLHWTLSFYPAGWSTSSHYTNSSGFLSVLVVLRLPPFWQTAALYKATFMPGFSACSLLWWKLMKNYLGISNAHNLMAKYRTDKGLSLLGSSSMGRKKSMPFLIWLLTDVFKKNFICTCHWFTDTPSHLITGHFVSLFSLHVIFLHIRSHNLGFFPSPVSVYLGLFHRLK